MIDLTCYKAIKSLQSSIRTLTFFVIVEIAIGVGIIWLVVESHLKYFSLLLFLVVPLLIIESRRYSRLYTRIKNNQLEIGLINGIIILERKRIKSIEPFDDKVRRMFFWKRPYVRGSTLFTAINGMEVFLIKLTGMFELSLKGKIFTFDGIVINLENVDLLKYVMIEKASMKKKKARSFG